MAPNRAKAARKVPTNSRKRPLIAEELEVERRPDHEEITEKDETEEKLEKLIFGDEAGFLDSLKPDATGQELVRTSHLGEVEEQHETDEDLEGVADEDVWSASSLPQQMHPG